MGKGARVQGLAAGTWGRRGGHASCSQHPAARMVAPYARINRSPPGVGHREHHVGYQPAQRLNKEVQRRADVVGIRNRQHRYCSSRPWPRLTHQPPDPWPPQGQAPLSAERPGKVHGLGSDRLRREGRHPGSRLVRLAGWHLRAAGAERGGALGSANIGRRVCACRKMSLSRSRFKLSQFEATVSEVAPHFQDRPPPLGGPEFPTDREPWPDPNKDARSPPCHSEIQ